MPAARGNATSRRIAVAERVFVADHNKRIMVLLGLLYIGQGCVGFAMAATALWLPPHTGWVNLAMALVGLVGGTVFVGWGFWYVGAVFRRTPALAVSSEGIYDNTEPWSLGLIR